ncbi:MAG TPA: serine hydrolase domain-containing protein [Rhodanobacteraceae bacterium]|jgi:CubicO group peptidase (beta-lactamase class C family)|nr:serine hydrolase domain-containing protein [Rhodanobacteraceae bacterium]
MRAIRFFRLSVVCALAFAARVHAFDLPADFRAAIEQGIANGRYQGIAIGFIDRDERGEWTFGAAEPGGAAPTSADAFELGSTTRSFTGLLLADAIVARKVRLDETLGKIFADIRFADPRLAAATVAELATHRAGLPTIAPNLFPRSVDDPYIAYDDRALLGYLAHARLESAPGRYLYSDLGVALIGEVVARATGADYRNALARRVLAPLAMTQSGFGAVPRLLDGYRDGIVVPHWQHQALAPAAGLRATLTDLMKFAAIELRPEASPLREAILLARDPRAAAGGGETAIAWQIVPVESDGQNWPLLWQAGITGGFASFVGLRTDKQRAVVILGNAGVDVSLLGLSLLAGRPAPSAPPKLLPMVAPATLAYEGWYRFDTGGDLVVRATSDGLVAQVTGLLPQTMSAYDDDAFELAGGMSQLTFQREQTKIAGAILHRHGSHYHAERLSDGAPTLRRKSSASSAADLAAFAGDYALSPSMRARVVVATPGLRVQLTGSVPSFVQLCAVDRFCDADGTLEVAFERDAKRKVSGLDWRQGVFEARAPRDDWAAEEHENREQDRR